MTATAPATAPATATASGAGVFGRGVMLDTDGIATALIALLVLVAVSIPLAVWKLVDIAIWIATHVSIDW